MIDVKAIIVLDDISKDSIKSNVSTLISRGIYIVNSLSEITDQMLTDTHTVFIMEGLLQINDGLASLRLYKAMLNLEYIFLMQKSKWTPILRKLGKLYPTDIVNLNFEILQAALYDDRSLEYVSQDQISSDNLKLIDKICKNDNDYTANEVLLANTLKNVLDRERTYINTMEQATLLSEQLSTENAVLKRSNAAYLAEYTKMFAKATKLNAALSQYEIIFTKDIYTKVDLYTHSERPTIVYIKEYEWLAGLDKLIETLFNAVRIQGKRSVKVLRLFDSSSSRRLLTLPKYYHVIKSRYKMADVETSDFVCKTGDYVRILDGLLLNRTHLDVLIIVDSKDHNDTVLAGSHIIFNTCGRKSSLEAFHLNPSNTITNDDTELHWEDYDTGTMDKQESFIFLSNQPAIGTILQTIYQFGEV